MVLVNEMGVKASPLAVYIPQDGVVVCFLFYVFFFFFGFFFYCGHSGGYSLCENLPAVKTSGVEDAGLSEGAGAQSTDLWPTS